MKIDKIIAALKGAKSGLHKGNLHDFEYGRPFCGCALGELFHAAGLDRRQIDTAEGCVVGYAQMADGLLGSLYGVDAHEVATIYHANDSFRGPKIARRDYMVRWVEAFHKLREEGYPPQLADRQARTEASS